MTGPRQFSAAMEFGSADALSTIARNLGSKGGDEAVKVAREQLATQRELVASSRKIEGAIPRLIPTVKDI